MVLDHGHLDNVVASRHYEEKLQKNFNRPYLCNMYTCNHTGPKDLKKIVSDP